MKTILRSVKDRTLFTIDTYRALGSMERVLFILLVVLLKVPQAFFDSLLTLAHSATSPLALKLADFVLKVMIRLSCRVSSVTLMSRVVQFVMLLLSYLTKNQARSCTSCSEISLTRGEGLAPLRIYKSETSTPKHQ